MRAGRTRAFAAGLAGLSLKLGLLVSIAACLGGCASGGGFLPMASRGDEPWQLPDDAFPTQRLFRIRYDGPEGDLSFKLTLYLENRQRFRMDASDSLGRRVWTLSVDEQDEAVWLDHREKLFCRVAGASGQSFVPIAYLPLVHLPRLILGRLPADPASDLRRSDGRISYADAGGQTWSGQLDAEGRVLWWSLVEDGEAIAWWKLRAEDDQGSQVFVDRRRDQEVRWVEQVRETLATPLAPTEIPERYEEGICGGAELGKALGEELGDEALEESEGAPDGDGIEDVVDPYRGLDRSGSLVGPE